MSRLVVNTDERRGTGISESRTCRRERRADRRLVTLPAVDAVALTCTSTTIFSHSLVGGGSTGEPSAQNVQGYVAPMVPAGETVVAKYWRWSATEQVWVLRDTKRHGVTHSSSTTSCAFFSTTFSSSVPSSGTSSTQTLAPLPDIGLRTGRAGGTPERVPPETIFGFSFSDLPRCAKLSRVGRGARDPNVSSLCPLLVFVHLTEGIA